MRGRRDFGGGEATALLRLRRGMIDLEDAQARFGFQAIRESVEPRPEHDDLPDAFGNRAVRCVLGDAAAHGDAEPQAPPAGVFGGLGQRALGVLPENAQRQRIGENPPALKHLMRRPMPGGANRSAAELGRLHGRRLTGRGGVVDWADQV